ncbi:MAG: 3-keto-5-aminohexanoate cleavage protein [Rhodobacteraceae bacterium]|nr:3-keto-5-aminohexanoate cleavage protein [Paracoccaceae bacterium]
MARWITCAVNGSVVGRDVTPYVAITPAEIAADACAAARAGAAVVHCHVRDPATGRSSNDPALYAELVARIREVDADVLVHLSSGGGGTLPVALTTPAIAPADAAAILPPAARIAHLVPSGADLTGLDCGSFSYGTGGDVYLSPTDMLYRIADLLRPTRVLPELTVFDLGQMALAAEMRARGAVPGQTPFCIGFGVIWGAPARPAALAAMLDLLPEGVDWGASSKGEAAHRAIAPLIVERGGGLRTGIEDHPTLDGVPVPNARLVEEAARVMAAQGAAPLTARALRARLGLG